MSKGWIGVDLDGTLAHYNQWSGIEIIGEPIPKMINRVRGWLYEGFDVKIFTARAIVPESIPYIETWCEKHIGVKLPVVFAKDFDMLELWDDRCVQVFKNTGFTYKEKLESVLKYLYSMNIGVDDYKQIESIING